MCDLLQTSISSYIWPDCSLVLTICREY